jgi:hypothetical protein
MAPEGNGERPALPEAASHAPRMSAIGALESRGLLATDALDKEIERAAMAILPALSTPQPTSAGFAGLQLNDITAPWRWLR